MTIIRDGKEITLTAAELDQAFMEQLELFIYSEVKCYVDAECDYVHFESEDQRKELVDYVASGIYSDYEDFCTPMVNETQIEWRVTDAINDLGLKTEDDDDEDDGEEEALRKIDEELAERNRPNELKCSNCSFSWFEESVGHDVCHFHRLGDWDPAPCEQ